jgi:hypothetical protein
MITKTEMIVDISQGPVSISAFSNTKKIGITLTGGADSAIMLYMLMVFKKEYRPDLEIVPITPIDSRKPYQEIFAKAVIDYVENKLAIKLNDTNLHLTELLDGERENYQFNKSVWVNKVKTYNGLQETYMSETLNPSYDIEHDWFFAGAGRDPSRDVVADLSLSRYVRNHHPFRNINKQGVRELYEYYNVLDELFPLTRSCENITTNFKMHCGFCWACAEREWGFDKLV